MYMHWLNYVRLNRKEQLKNTSGTTLEVTMIADVHSAISSVYQCMTGPCDMSIWMSLTRIGRQGVKGGSLVS